MRVKNKPARFSNVLTSYFLKMHTENLETNKKSIKGISLGGGQTDVVVTVGSLFTFFSLTVSLSYISMRLYYIYTNI